MPLTKRDGGYYIDHEIDPEFQYYWSKVFNGHLLKHDEDVLPILVNNIDGIDKILSEIPKSGPVVLDVGVEGKDCYEITIVPLENTLVWGIFDISGSRLLQRQIQRQKETIELIDHAHPGALFQVKRDENLMLSFDFVSPRLAEVLQIPNLSVEEFMHSVSKESREKIFNYFRYNNGESEIVFDGILEKPQIRYWNLRASLLAHDDNNTTTFLGVLENNTEKMLQLEQIKYTSTFLSSITQSVPIGIAVSNLPEKRYLYVNQEFCHITGYKEEDFLNGGFAFWRDNILLHHKEHLFENLDQIHHHFNIDNRPIDVPIKLNITILNRKGEERSILVSVRPLGEKSPSGSYDTFIHLLEDITERVRLENQRRKDEILLVQSNKMAELGEMASCIAHEINNPLSIMSHLLENVESRHPDDEFQHIFLTLERISKIVKALTTFAHDAGGMGPGDTPVPLEQIIKDTMILCHNKLLNKHIRWEVTGDLEACPHINETLLSQVLLNLINNSYDALEDVEGEKWMKLEISVKNGGLSIIFSDAGIAPDITVMQSWFEPFHTSKPKGKGTGLGLSICQNLLRSAGGAIRPLVRYNTSLQISLPLWPKA